MPEFSHMRYMRNRSQLKTEYSISALSRSLQVIKEYSNTEWLDQIPSEILDDVLNKTDDAAVSIRASLHRMLGEKKKIIRTVPTDIYSIPADVKFIDGTLRVFTLLPLTRKYSHKYTLSEYVKASLLLYQDMNRITLRFSIAPPYACILSKHLHRFSSRIPDNTNEDAQIINAVFGDVLMKSDAPANVPVFTASTIIVNEDEPEGAELIVCPVCRYQDVFKTAVLDKIHQETG